MNKQNMHTSIWTPANIVTLLRICLIPVFVIVLLSPWPEWFGIHDLINDKQKAIIAAGVFIVISCTDWIDGYLARNRNEVTDFGKFIDPLADKMLVAAALIALVELQVIPSWPVLIILVREFIVSGIRMVAANKGVVIAASWYGKAKTVLQIAAIVLFIVKDALDVPTTSAPIENPLYVISWAVMIAALILTIISMLDYIAKAKPLLFSADKNSVDDNSSENKSVENKSVDDNSSDNKSVESKSVDDISDNNTSIDDTSGNNESNDNTCVTSDICTIYSPKSMPSIQKLSTSIISLAREHNIHIATAESLTGGMIIGALTSVPGSSHVISGSAVTYAIDAKSALLGVDRHLLETNGAVDETVAEQMATGAAKALQANLTVAVTGIAGPTGSEPGKPVGTVYMAICFNEATDVSRLNLDGDREEIRTKTVVAALHALQDRLTMSEKPSNPSKKS